MCVELRELHSNEAIRISASAKNTFDTHIIMIQGSKKYTDRSDKIDITLKKRNY